jgi:phosphatidylserine/phosphatidylglycerophosphate/cardiolipin synthase-like enzyme
MNSINDNTLSRHLYRFPWRDGNHYQFLVDGSEFYPAMLDSIKSAEDYILLEMYLFESSDIATRFINAMIAARQRNVLVYLILDDYGSKGLNRQDRQLLLRAGIHLCFFNPVRRGWFLRNLRRTHRKILVIDGNTAFTGGAGICKGFDPDIKGKLYWHDTMTRIEGPCVGDWETLFRDNWVQYASTPLPDTPPDPPTYKEGCRGHVTISRSPVRSEIMRSFIRHIRRARRQIWLTTPYFVTSRKFRRSLKRQAANGVDVRILLPGPHSDHPWTRFAGRHYYTSLLRQGVRIFEYQPRFIHAKHLICDEWVSVGSSNADRWNLRWNLDANQEICCPAISHAMTALFEQDFGQSREIELERWRHRSWRSKLFEWLSRQIVRFLSWFSYNRKH